MLTSLQQPSNSCQVHLYAKKIKPTCYKHKDAPYYLSLNEIERFFLHCFHTRKRSCKISYGRIQKLLNLNSRDSARRFICNLKELGIINIRPTLYKDGAKIAGINIYTLTTLGNKHLNMMLDQAWNANPIPFEFKLPFKITDKRSFYRLRKKELIKLSFEPYERKITKVINICQETALRFKKLFDSYSFEKEFLKGNKFNHNCLSDYPDDVIKKVLKKMDGKRGKIKHFWKFLTYLLNEAQKNTLDFREKVISKLASNEKLEGVDCLQVQDSFKHLKIEKKEIEALYFRSKGDVSRMVTALKIFEKTKRKKFKRKKSAERKEVEKRWRATYILEDQEKIQDMTSTCEQGYLKGIYSKEKDMYIFPELYRGESKLVVKKIFHSGKQVATKSTYSPDYSNCYFKDEEIFLFKIFDVRRQKDYFYKTLKETLKECHERGYKLSQREMRSEKPQSRKNKSVGMGYLFWLVDQNFESVEHYFKSCQKRKQQTQTQTQTA